MHLKFYFIEKQFILFQFLGPEISTRDTFLFPYQKGSYSCPGPRTIVQMRDGDICVPLCDKHFLYRARDKYLAKVRLNKIKYFKF